MRLEKIGRIGNGSTYDVATQKVTNVPPLGSCGGVMPGTKQSKAEQERERERESMCVVWSGRPMSHPVPKPSGQDNSNGPAQLSCHVARSQYQVKSKSKSTTRSNFKSKSSPIPVPVLVPILPWSAGQVSQWGHVMSLTSILSFDPPQGS